MGATFCAGQNDSWMLNFIACDADNTSWAYQAANVTVVLTCVDHHNGLFTWACTFDGTGDPPCACEWQKVNTDQNLCAGGSMGHDELVGGTCMVDGAPIVAWAAV